MHKISLRTMCHPACCAALLLVFIGFGVGCGFTSNSSAPVPAPAAVRSYNGTASVGDFLSITLDADAHTITYSNRSNGDAGSVPYTVNSDGTYTLADPTGNLIAAYEVPEYALLIQAAKTGPDHNTPALITAVNSAPISLATWENHTYNYMQFRTNSGGLEVGSVALDAQANVSINSYWPYGAASNQNPFHAGGFPSSNFQNDPSGTFIKRDDGAGSFDYIFGTANGVFAVDTANGAILGLQQAASKAFDPSFAGTYKAIFYNKQNATTGQANVESGTASLGKATITIGSTGTVTVQDAQGNNIIQTTLTPVADTAYLQGAGKLSNPCNGLFTFRVTTPNSQQDVFVSFQNRALLFASFTVPLPILPGNSYDYTYGVGIH